MKVERKVVKVKCKVYPPCEYDMVIEYAVSENGEKMVRTQYPCEQGCIREECEACQADVIASVLGE